MKIEVITTTRRKETTMPTQAPTRRFKPRLPLKRGKVAKRPKISKQAKLRAYGMPSKFQWSNLRYKQPFQKGILWYFFSLYTRTRDVKEWGTCISCLRRITVDTCDAGHFMPAGSCGRDLLFDETNVNAECPHCNAWDDTHLLGYAENLDKRYATGTATELRARRELYRRGSPLKDFSVAEYEQKITEFKEKLKTL